MLRSISTAFVLALLLGMGPAYGQSDFVISTVLPDSSAPQSATIDARSDSDPDVDRPAWDDVGATVSDHAETYVGAYAGHGALYERESLLYRTPPPLRYNRVEGPVVGVHREPLRFGSHDDTRVFGQFAYAFELEDIRYTVGLESQLYSTERMGLKLGVTYQEQTLSSDRWKTSYLENSLASVGFRYDFFDYYEAEGATIYGVQDLPGSFQLAGGFRTEAHRAVDVNTNWSLFGDGSFRPNPAVDEGRLQLLFASITAGRVRDFDDLPTGGAVRLAAMTTDGLAGDFSFTRYEADGRVFVPLTSDTRLGLRLRGGYATKGAPPQSQFTLGGVGSVRSYGQNRFRGTRMLLGNAEYMIDGATLLDGALDDLFLVGLADAGWVGASGERPQADEVLPSAGFGVGLEERRVRLDVTWPLRDVPGAASSPSIWLRITPNF